MTVVAQEQSQGVGPWFEFQRRFGLATSIVNVLRVGRNRQREIGDGTIDQQMVVAGFGSLPL